MNGINAASPATKKARRKFSSTGIFKASGLGGSLDIGGTAEFRIRKSNEDGGGTSFADYVWKPVALIEMKKRGENLQKHCRQAFDTGRASARTARPRTRPAPRRRTAF